MKSWELQSTRLFDETKNIIQGWKYDHYGRYFQINDLKITWPVSRTVLTSKNYRQSKQVPKPLLTSGLCIRHDSTIRESIQPFLPISLSLFILSTLLFTLSFTLCQTKQSWASERASSLIFHAAQFDIFGFLYSDFPFALHPGKLILLFVVHYIRVTNGR